MSNFEILTGDCREKLASIEAKSVRCCVTSPPYFGLRSYLPDGVRLRHDLTDEQRQEILRELDALGILPTTE